ncbi:PIN domain-like protein [Ophiobolus disseminans]|uniref:PIN domain-like protein n=1 Tax=Ophiobolus disseminans TaxID=1469910 RepID=A0A6A6ZK64_9PLEO|nr:PIN domain-like protein [Ophiobolus disseminans]
MTSVYRICNLLTLNIELVFVLDGEDIPPKRRHTQPGRIVSRKKRELLKELLTNLDIPFIDAPGKVEAQCCHLQALGIVDAVWPQDSDRLMFGCQLRLRDYRIPKDTGYSNQNKGQTKKAAKEVCVLYASVLQEKHRLRREGCVLLEMLAGGNYSKGPMGCGAETALKAAKAGIGINLSKAQSAADCDRWRQKVLLPYFKRQKVQIAVPSTFPYFKILQWCNTLRIFADAVLLENPKLQLHYVRKVRETALLRMMIERFNLWGHGYMDWIIPTMLTRSLAEKNPFPPCDAPFQIKLVGRQVKKSDDRLFLLERNITFSPFELIRPLGPVFFDHISRNWSTDLEDVFSLDYRVERKISTYLLREVLSPGLLDPTVLKSKPSTSKRR